MLPRRKIAVLVNAIVHCAKRPANSGPGNDLCSDSDSRPFAIRKMSATGSSVEGSGSIASVADYFDNFTPP